MFELIEVSERCYYIQSPAKIGLWRLNDSEVCLIDSGNDRDAGRKIRQILDAKGWKLRAIYNTHANADHIGGNKYLQGQTKCKVYAPGIDCAITRYPVLEPALLFGAYPCKDLRHKFLMASESEAEELTEDVLPEGFEIIKLPGHFFDMVGFRTPDDIVFLADCLSSKETLEKYQIGYIYDVAAYLSTLESVKGLSAKLFVPSHAEPTEDIAPLAQVNIDKVNEISERILAKCENGIRFEDLLAQLFDEYSLRMTFEQHALVGSTVRSYLAYLRDAGRVEPVFEGNYMRWKRV